jgi:hypothetical protein
LNLPQNHLIVKSDGFVKSLKTADLSLRAKRGNLRTARIAERLPRRFAPRNDGAGLFTRPSNLIHTAKEEETPKKAKNIDQNRLSSSFYC